jgi:hypothetical protein
MNIKTNEVGLHTIEKTHAHVSNLRVCFPLLSAGLLEIKTKNYYRNTNAPSREHVGLDDKSALLLTDTLCGTRPDKSSVSFIFGLLLIFVFHKEVVGGFIQQLSDC